MCGFIGFVGDTQNKDTIIEKMSERIVHRGPDSFGKYTDENYAVAFRRLSIIDIDSSNQPIYNENGDLVLVFNGEIYNFASLRNDLLEKGHIFKTEGDSEVLVHLYEEYGENMANMLRGMFGFAIFDKKDN